MDATRSPDFSAGKPRVLYAALMEVSPDGQRFLAIQVVVPDQLPTNVNVVVNPEWAHAHHSCSQLLLSR